MRTRHRVTKRTILAGTTSCNEKDEYEFEFYGPVFDIDHDWSIEIHFITFVQEFGNTILSSSSHLSCEYNISIL